MSQMMPDPDLLASFLDEAGQCVATLNDKLLAAENGDLTDEMIGEMFRAAHSMKGAAGFLNLAKILQVTHSLETILDRIRKGKSQFNTETVDALFQALDTISALLVELAAESLEKTEITETLAALNALIDEPKQVKTAENPEEELGPLPEWIRGKLTIDDVLETLIAKNGGQKPYLLRIPLSAILSGGGDPMESYHTLENALHMQTILPLAKGCESPWQNLEDYNYAIAILCFTAHDPADALTEARILQADIIPICTEDDILETIPFAHPESVGLSQRISTLSIKEDMQKHCGLWISETKDELQSLEKLLMSHEDQPNDSNLLNETFRLMHRLKGSSSSMGLEEMARVAHNCESILSDCRDKKAVLDEPVLHILFRCQDYLSQCLERIENGLTDAPDSKEIDAALAAVLNHSDTRDDTPSLLAAWSFSKEQSEIVEEHRRAGTSMYRIAVALDPEAPLADLRYSMLIQKLEDTGHVLFSEPPQETLEAGMETPPPLRAVVTNVTSVTLQQTLTADMVWKIEIEEIIPLSDNSKKTGEDKSTNQQPASKTRSSITTLQDTVRVDTTRLDYMMNVAGELSITKARITQLSDDLAHQINTIDPRLIEFVIWRGKQANEQGGNGLPADRIRQLEQWTETIKRAQVASASLRDATVTLHRHTSALQNSVMQIRMVPIGPLFQRFHRLVRDLCKESGRDAKLITLGENTELDKRLIDELADPLTHLIRNSVDHGLETPDDRTKAGKEKQGSVHLEAFHEGSQICIRIRDDGRGLHREKIIAKAISNGITTPEAAERMSDPDIYALIFQPGFSTAEKVTNISGRGVGMDIVKSKVNELKGKIDIESTPGEGCVFTIRLPLTLAIINALLVKIGGAKYAMPLESVKEIVELAPEDIRSVEGKGKAIFLRDQVIALADLSETIGLQPLNQQSDTIRAVVTKSQQETIALAVDHIIGDEEIVVKALAGEFAGVQGISGATVLGDGGIALILDINTIGELTRSGAMLGKRTSFVGDQTNG